MGTRVQGGKHLDIDTGIDAFISHRIQFYIAIVGLKMGKDYY